MLIEAQNLVIFIWSFSAGHSSSYWGT